VIVVTAATMAVEIVTGLWFGSMALLADGLHMASHTAALTVAFLAYVYARRYARDERFSFGTGKVNALGGFTGAVLLAVVALLMAWGSAQRLAHPVAIQFDQAILVAVLGLAVNAASAFILGGRAGPAAGEHADAAPQGPAHPDAHPHPHARREDHNLRSAYLHVLADALTSVLALAALLSGKYFGLAWMDPVTGLVGSVLVANWSAGLIRATSRVLLDHQAPRSVQTAIRAALESCAGTRVTDLHVWAVGPGAWAAAITVESPCPPPTAEYKTRLPAGLGLVHVTVEVHGAGREVGASGAHAGGAAP
jgi:cation diffusion facilitator family transporter